MPTYRIVFESTKATDLIVEAAILDFSNPGVVFLLSEDDQHVVAAIPTDKLLYIVERANRSSRTVRA